MLNLVQELEFAEKSYFSRFIYWPQLSIQELDSIPKEFFDKLNGERLMPKGILTELVGFKYKNQTKSVILCEGYIISNHNYFSRICDGKPNTHFKRLGIFDNGHLLELIEDSNLLEKISMIGYKKLKA